MTIARTRAAPSQTLPRAVLPERSPSAPEWSPEVGRLRKQAHAALDDLLVVPGAAKLVRRYDVLAGARVAKREEIALWMAIEVGRKLGASGDASSARASGAVSPKEQRGKLRLGQRPAGERALPEQNDDSTAISPYGIVVDGHGSAVLMTYDTDPLSNAEIAELIPAVAAPDASRRRRRH